MNPITNPTPSSSADGTRERSATARQGDGMSTIIKLARVLARQAAAEFAAASSAAGLSVGAVA